MVFRAKPSSPRLRHDHPLAAGLIDFWSAHEGSGPVTRGAAGHEATDGGGPSWVSGPYGPAKRLQRASGDYLTIASSPDFDAAGAITVAMLVKVDSLSVDQRAISRWGGSGADRSWILVMDSGGGGAGWKFTVTDGTAQDQVGQTVASASAGVWQLVAGVYDGQQVLVHVDGAVADAATATIAQLNQPVHPIEVGRRSQGAPWFDGDVAMWALWRRALSEMELRRLGGDPFAPVRPRRLVIALAGAIVAPSGPSGVQLSQSAAAAFPDRPAGGGSGLLVTMAPGGDGSYLERDLGEAKDPLHTRLMLNAATATGDAAVILRGLDDAGGETFRLRFDAALRRVELLPVGGPMLISDPLTALPWHSVEAKLDAAGGAAQLWIDGLEAAATGSATALAATRRLWIGAPFKDSGATGELYLDEWVMSDQYIGPAVTPPTGLHADDPARWLVVYNAADADSAAWAEAYRQARGAPLANLLGLDLSAAEQVSEPEFLSMRSAIEDYLDRHGLAEQVIGILCGYGVPGSYTRPDGRAEHIAGQLHRIDGLMGPVDNPLAALEQGDPIIRPTAVNLDGHRLTARIDGPTLDDALALTERAAALEQDAPGGDETDPGSDAKIWLDPYGPDDPLYELRQSQMAAWASGLDRQRLRLPLELSAQSDPGQDVQFAQIHDDGFFWGWDQPTPPAGFFGTPAGRRVFCLQLAFNTATAPTLRDAMDPSWAIAALQAGYAATAGGSRDYSPSAVPLVRPFFEALRRGWTLGEAWFLACPLLRTGLMLVGDPLLSVRPPQGGWNLYGPFDSWAEGAFDSPIAAMRETEREVAIAAAHQPVDGGEAIYVLRHLDGEGREEAGLTHVWVQRAGAALRSVPWGPVWPSAPGWSAGRRDGQWEIRAAWAGRFGELNVSRVELIEQAEGGAAQVVHAADVDPGASRATWQRPVKMSPVRFRVRAIAPDGGTSESAWSAWHEGGAAMALKPLQLIE